MPRQGSSAKALHAAVAHPYPLPSSYSHHVQPPALVRTPTIATAPPPLSGHTSPSPSPSSSVQMSVSRQSSQKAIHASVAPPYPYPSSYGHYVSSPTSAQPPAHSAYAHHLSPSQYGHHHLPHPQLSHAHPQHHVQQDQHLQHQQLSPIHDPQQQQHHHSHSFQQLPSPVHAHLPQSPRESPHLLTQPPLQPSIQHHQIPKDEPQSQNFHDASTVGSDGSESPEIVTNGLIQQQHQHQHRQQQQQQLQEQQPQHLKQTPSPQSTPTAPAALATATPATTVTQSEPAPAPKKKHVCPTCQRAFTTSGHLARHTRVHTGERNHKCPFPGCETRCSRQDNLQQHYRIHLSPGSRRSNSSATRAAVQRAMSHKNPAVTVPTAVSATSLPPPPSTAPPLVHATLSPPALAPASYPAPLAQPHVMPPLVHASAPSHVYPESGSTASDPVPPLSAPPLGSAVRSHLSYPSALHDNTVVGQTGYISRSYSLHGHGSSQNNVRGGYVPLSKSYAS